jgi:hypothetical protein
MKLTLYFEGSNAGHVHGTHSNHTPLPAQKDAPIPPLRAGTLTPMFRPRHNRPVVDLERGRFHEAKDFLSRVRHLTEFINKELHE